MGMERPDADMGWKKLLDLAANGPPMPDLSDARTANARRVSVAGLTLDYSKARVNDKILDELTDLTRVRKLPDRMTEFLNRQQVNFTEERVADHCQLRKPNAEPEVANEMERMLGFADTVAAGDFKLPSGKPVASILHVGIGGSYLGPKLYYEALPMRLPCSFVANIDPAAITEALRLHDPASTLVVAVSKSGTTVETLANTTAAMKWLGANGCKDPAGHLVTVSANPAMADGLGNPPNQRFAMWEWVGGRYSVWSPVSVSVAAAGGTAAFREFLAGANAIDQHINDMLSGTVPENLVYSMAMLRIWHGLSLSAQSHCVVAYQHRLRSLPAYLQQLVMESNGKSVTHDGIAPTVPTSGVWWGGEGTNDQHAYYQLLLQGTRPVSVDFIVALKAQPGEDEEMQRHLLANALGQSNALAQGRDLGTCQRELEAKGIEPARARMLAPHMVVPGGQPVNLIYFERLSPAILGSLLAAYEHMTVAMGFAWDINPFDQWGVELGKINFRMALDAIKGKGGEDQQPLDPASTQVIKEASR